MRSLLDAAGEPPPSWKRAATRWWSAIVTGFGLPDDAIHGANESFRLESLELGERASRELYAELASV